MTDFEWDCLQKKRIGHGEQHRVKARRGCNLPHESLTPAQLKKKSSEVILVNINRPMSYKAFKMLSVTTQCEYLDGLRSRFHCNDKMLAEMLSTTPATLSRYFAIRGIPSGKGVRPSDAELAAWQSWLDDSATVVAENAATEETTEEVDHAAVVEAAAESVAEILARDENPIPVKPFYEFRLPHNHSTAVKGGMTLLGTPKDCADRLLRLFEPNTEVRLVVNWEVTT